MSSRLGEQQRYSRSPAISSRSHPRRRKPPSGSRRQCLPDPAGPVGPCVTLRPWRPCWSRRALLPLRPGRSRRSGDELDVMEEVIEEMKRIVIPPSIRRRIGDKRDGEQDPRDRQYRLFHTPLLLAWLALSSSQSWHAWNRKKHLIYGTSTERNKRRTISSSAGPCCMMRKENGLRQYEDRAIYMRRT